MFRLAFFAAMIVAIVDLLFTFGVLTTHRTEVLMATSFAVTFIVATVSCRRVTEATDAKMAVAMAQALSTTMATDVTTAKQAAELVELWRNRYYGSEHELAEVNVRFLGLKVKHAELEKEVSSLRQDLTEEVSHTNLWDAPSISMARGIPVDYEHHGVRVQQAVVISTVPTPVIDMIVDRAIV